MSLWSFPNLNAFRAALSALPTEAVSHAVHAGRDGDAVLIEAPATLDRTLQRLGVTRVPPTPGRPARKLAALCSWAEVLPVTAGSVPGVVASTIFAFDGALAARGDDPPSVAAALALAGEMVRLGCDRQELAVHGATTLLRVTAPPYYSVLRALDAKEPMRAYVPAGRVWVEVGGTHVLAASLRAAPGELWLLPRTGPWAAFPDGPWTPLDARLDLLLEPNVPAPATAPNGRLTVPLRFGRAPVRAASLWICDDVAAVDRLIQDLPEGIANQLELAVLPGPPERVVFRTRPGLRASPELPGRAFAPMANVPGVFVPVGVAVEPPVRPDRLRTILSPPAGTVGWVEEEGEPRRLRVRFIEAEQFVRLDAWVDYLMERDAEIVQAWVGGPQFRFEALRVTSAPSRSEPAERPARERRPSAAPTAPPVLAVPLAPPLTPPRASRLPPVRVDLTPDAAARAVEVAERAFLDSPAAMDAPERTTIWAELGGLYARAGRPREAGLAWARATWADATFVVPFHASMVALQGAPLPLVGLPEPTREQVRTVASGLLSGALPAAAARPHLERFGRLLDLRTWWLTQVHLARPPGTSGRGDTLLLARARDVVFGQLQAGLPVSRELPAFLRFAGVGSAARLAEPLERIRGQFFTIKRARHPLEAPIALSRVYVDLVFAWGLARLGVLDRAADLRDRALAGLPPSPDAVHTFCATGLSARVTQALEGAPADVPLPPAIADRLNTLVRFDRYKVDRLRQCCTILEPQERLDPIRAFAEHEADPRGAVFASLRGMADTEALADALSRILVDAAALPDAAAAPLLDGVLDFLPALPGSLLADRLAAALGAIGRLPLELRAPLAAEALTVASVAREGAQVEVATRLVLASFGPLGATHPTVVHHLSGVLRSLRRAGRTEDARPLLDALHEALGPRDSIENLPARLSVAGGLLATSRFEEAQPTFEAVWKRLGQKPPPLERMALTRGLSRAQAFATPEAAVETALRLFQHLENITDSLNTNSHFALSLVEYAECIVTTLAHEDLSLGERGRRIVEEDEFLLRQRVHRDLAG